MVTLLANGSVAPSYETMKKLFENGMTAEELFGIEVKNTISDADCEKIAEFIVQRLK
ncbi:hypothetical protein [Fibrobacter sp. UWH4]|uniref:hypothetical protein n=1 Tax=Fibrobacter sp. UWH4 TaxID=1896210 RepID=UPI0009151666|nr:hypothetical protein [Fibrobacter sp. UWH4]SHL05280.1 hypothetical protein SAMN05720762_10467 [Fibrobacter sp. UWH4]